MATVAARSSDGGGRFSFSDHSGLSVIFHPSFRSATSPANRGRVPDGNANCNLSSSLSLIHFDRCDVDWSNFLTFKKRFVCGIDYCFL